MPNQKKITEIIDQKAFDQFVLLRKELTDAQADFLKLVGAVKQLNDEIGKAGSVDVLYQ